MKTMMRVLALALLAAASTAVDTDGIGARQLRSPAVEETVVKPLEFKQQLLICNAYPGDSLVTIKHNNAEVFDHERRGVSFRECRYAMSRVQPKDKLDFKVENMETEGAFEIGELPSSDAMLLLVLSRDAKSPLIKFQSFAFPTGSESEAKDAQLAVIDALEGSSGSPHLKMEDHVTRKEGHTISKRVEQLNFNRVYAIEEGTYDTSVMDQSEEKSESSTRHTVHLARNQNYVLLRTGGGKYAQSLVMFPDQRSGAARPCVVIALIAAVTTAFGLTA